MGDQSIMNADLLALLQDIDSSTMPALGSLSGESDSVDLIDLELDLFADQSDGASMTQDYRSNNTAISHTAMVVASESSTSHVERCRMNRKRKKQELDELRTSADALQATLSRLRDQTSNTRHNMSPSSSSWRSVSKRTLLECHKAVKENSKLREMLQQQLTAAQGIRRAIQAVPDLQALPLRVTDSPSSLTTGTSHAASAFSASLTHPDKQYYDLFKSIHSVYEQNTSGLELSWLKIGTRKISMEMVTGAGSDCTDMCVQVMECQQLSMSLADVNDATWKHLSTPHCDDNNAQSEDCARAQLQRHGDDLFGDCGSDCKPISTTGDTTLGRLAVRRYVDVNRLTFVWECDGCFQCDAAKNPIGRVTERGWCTIEPSGDDPMSASTVLRIQVQYIPQQSECKTNSGKCLPSQHVNLSSDLALQLYRGTIARTFGAVEKEVFKKKTPNATGKSCY